MKTLLSTLACSGTLLFATVAAPADKAPAPATTEAQKTINAASQPVPKSAFGIPSKPVDGHDPFFPTSDRLFAIKTTPKAVGAPINTAIVFNGISGSKDHQLAMINGHTFAEGEEAPVNTSAGRIHVLLVAIKDDRAVVEIAGERRELTFQGR